MKERTDVSAKHGKLRVVEDFRVPVKRVLEAAIANKLKRVMVIGIDSKGEIYAAGSCGTNQNVQDIELFLAKLEAGDYDVSEADVKAA